MMISISPFVFALAVTIVVGLLGGFMSAVFFGVGVVLGFVVAIGND